MYKTKKIIMPLRLIIWIIFLLFNILSIIALFFVFQKALTLSFDFSYKGLKALIELFSPFRGLIAFTFVLFPILIAISNLISNIFIQEGKALLDLRTMLNQADNLEIHQNFRGTSGKWTNGIPLSDDNNDNWRKIDNYLGVFELANILIEKEVISFEYFENQFGYKFTNILSNQSVKDKIISENKLWTELIKLCKKMKISIT